MKRILAILIVLALAVSFTACSGGTVDPADNSANQSTDTQVEQSNAEVSNSAQPAGEGRDPRPAIKYTDDGRQLIKIAYSVENITEGYAALFKGLDERVAQINQERSDIVVQVDYFGAEFNVEKQMSDIETIILNGYDVVIFSPVDMVASEAALKKAYDAGLYIVEARGMDTQYYDVKLQAQNETVYGESLKDYVKNYLDDNPDVVLKGILLHGPVSISFIKPRLAGLQELAKEMPDRFQILSEQNVDPDAQKGMSVTEDMLQTYGDQVNFIASAIDQTALGIVNAVKSANKLNDIMIVSVDGDKNGVKMVDDGELACTVGLVWPKIGGNTADCAVELCLGMLTSDVYPSDSMFVVDKDTVGEFKNIQYSHSGLVELQDPTNLVPKQ